MGTITTLARIVAVHDVPGRPWEVREQLACGHSQVAQRHGARSRYCKACSQLLLAEERRTEAYRRQRREREQAAREARRARMVSP